LNFSLLKPGILTAEEFEIIKSPLDHDTTVRILTEGDGRTLPEHFDPALLKLFEALAPRFEEIFESLTDLPVRHYHAEEKRQGSI